MILCHTFTGFVGPQSYICLVGAGFSKQKEVQRILRGRVKDILSSSQTIIEDFMIIIECIDYHSVQFFFNEKEYQLRIFVRKRSFTTRKGRGE